MGLTNKNEATEVLRSAQLWCRVRIGIFIVSLVVSLATRTFPLTSSVRATARSGAAQAMRQHMDRDAAQWIAPAPLSSALCVPTFCLYSPPVRPPLGFLRDEKLWNRPPPSC